MNLVYFVLGLKLLRKILLFDAHCFFNFNFFYRCSQNYLHKLIYLFIELICLSKCRLARDRLDLKLDLSLSTMTSKFEFRRFSKSANHWFGKRSYLWRTVLPFRVCSIVTQNSFQVLFSDEQQSSFLTKMAGKMPLSHYRHSCAVPWLSITNNHDKITDWWALVFFGHELHFGSLVCIRYLKWHSSNKMCLTKMLLSVCSPCLREEFDLARSVAKYEMYDTWTAGEYRILHGLRYKFTFR